MQAAFGSLCTEPKLHTHKALDLGFFLVCLGFDLGFFLESLGLDLGQPLPDLVDIGS